MDVSVEREDSSTLEEPRKALLENCSVCGTSLHQSRLPQLFPCLHSACSKCLSKQRKEERKTSIECSLCKRLFGYTEIMDNVIFKLSSPSSGKGNKKCGECEDLAVSGWCKECEKFLCSDCMYAHIRVKLTRTHTIVAQESSTGSHPTLYCQCHRGESLEFHCADCDVLTCCNCLSVDHRNHRYQMLSEAVSASREKLHSLEGAVTKQKDQVKQRLLDVDQRLQNIIDMKARLKNMLCWKVFKVYQVMLRKAFQLFQYAKGVYGTEEEQLFQQKAALEAMEERQNYVMSFIEKTLSTEGHAVVLLKNRIESQMNDLLCQRVPPALCMFEVKLQVDATVMTNVENFGRISVKLVPSAQNQADQLESVLERVPKLQNVPSDCINKATSVTSPDSSTQGALPSQSPVVPDYKHSQYPNTPVGLLQSMPSSSHTSQCTSPHTQNVSKDCIINAATSTTSPDTCAQAALCGQSPTVSSSDASQLHFYSSSGLQPCKASLLQAKTHVDGPNLQQEDAVSLLSVKTASSHQHQDQPNEFPPRLRDVMRFSKSRTNQVKTKDTQGVQVEYIDLTCDDAVSTAETINSSPPKSMVPVKNTHILKHIHVVQVDNIDLTCDTVNSKPPEKTVRHQVDLASSTHVRLADTQLKVNTSGSQDTIPPHDITEEALVEGQSTDNRKSAPLLPDAAESSICCGVCALDKGTLVCGKCGRCFHRKCHVPPITSQFIRHKWKCSLCQDFSNPTDPFRSDRSRRLCLSSLDQRRCEYLILGLMCKKNSCILYLSNKKATSLPVDFDFIHERLLRRRSPPYRTPSELVSDVWVLLDSLQSRSENTDDVLKMQKSFEKMVNQVFGDTLHPSLLTRPTMKRVRYLHKTEAQNERETLKRENTSEDYTEPVMKKPHLDSTDFGTISVYVD